MEKFCHVCGNSNSETEMKVETPITVFFICDDCLKKENLDPWLDQLFLNL